MATRVSRGRISMTSFNSPIQRKSRVGRKNLLYISCTSRVIADFASNFVTMATGVGRGKTCLVSFNSPTPKPPVISKDLGDICYIGRVMADFVRNFVAMATGVGRSRICLASFNSETSLLRSSYWPMK